MKKLSLYITLALSTLFLGSCGGDDYEDWASPQSNPQEDAITIPGYKATGVSAINLADVTGDSVATYSLSSATLPAGYQLTAGRIVLTPEGVDNATPATINTSVTGQTSKADLQSLIENVYGRKPEARTFSGHVYTSAIKDGEACLIDAGTVNVVVTPVAPDIAPAYYVLGGAKGWTEADALTQQFSHSATNVYDDPVFTITIKAATDAKTGEPADTWFAIADANALKALASNDWSHVLGTKAGNGNNKYDGTAEAIDYRANLSDDGSFKVPASAGAKYIRIELNMLDFTVKITPLSFDPYIYEVGNNNGWGNGFALFSPNSDGKYYGAFYLKSGFKFRSNLSDWNGKLNLGLNSANPKEGELVNDGGSKDIACTDGFYFVTVDLSASPYTYTLKPFTAMHVVGGAVGDWNEGKTMTYNAEARTWRVNNVKLVDGEIKFKDEDANWAGVNLGGSLGNLIQNGGNIAVKGGTYDIVLHLENQAAKAPYAELIKK
ncbi:MAG: DUF5115 domain-containing protein [Prevotella sp.]|nr:DUF5115 domain-containing protein [Prevotella sp.]